MHGFDVNWVAVLAAAAARFVIGGVWFAPFAFGPAWGRLVRIEPGHRARMVTAMVIDFVTGLVAAWVLANLLQFLGVHRFVAGARVSFFLWLGFIAMPFASSIAFEGRPWALFAIVAGFWLASMLVMGGLIGAM